MNNNKYSYPSERKMVGWYDLKQLFLTARDVAVSTFLSHHSDRRSFYTEWSKTPLKPTDRRSSYQEYSKTPLEPISFKTVQRDDDKDHTIYIGRSRIGITNPTHQKEDIWIDFVADTGDGGNSTYTVAKALFDEKLNITLADFAVPIGFPDAKSFFEEKLYITVNTEKGDSTISLPRGDLLILGGDLAYPVANETEYSEVFLNFFEAAIPIEVEREELPKEGKADRAVVSFPQNHDWYDNLSVFSQIFCRKEKETFLDMKCPQNQSYAAVSLPFDWWLFGLDFALSGDIDELQFVYFKKIIEANLNEDSKVIMQYPEPVWFLEALGFTPKNFHSKRYEALERLIEEKRGNKDIEIRLAGDQHYYRRYTKLPPKEDTSSTKQKHLITCGCGGAFLHPTHGPKEFKTIDFEHGLGKKDEASNYAFTKNSNKNPNSYTQEKTYPSEDDSYNLSKKNFGFLIHNFKFSYVTAVSYFLVVWMNFASLYGNVKHADLCIQNLKFINIIDAAQLWGWSLLLSPLSLLTSMTIIITFVFFTRQFNPHAKGFSTLIGIIHGIIHFVAIFLLYYFVLRIRGIDPVNDRLEIGPFFLIGLIIAAAGGIVGSQIMGLYLFVSVNLFKLSEKLHTIINYNIPMLHSNEAFSSLKIEDYKGFLRFRISAEKLEAFFIGIDKVPCVWEQDDPVKSKGEQNDPAKKNPSKWKPVKRNTLDTDGEPKLVDYWIVETPKKPQSKT